MRLLSAHRETPFLAARRVYSAAHRALTRATSGACAVLAASTSRACAPLNRAAEGYDLRSFGGTHENGCTLMVCDSLLRSISYSFGARHQYKVANQHDGEVAGDEEISLLEFTSARRDRRAMPPAVAEP